MVIASLLYTILGYEWFHRHPLLWVSSGDLEMSLKLVALLLHCEILILLINLVVFSNNPK